jgi:hypothetical protein
MTRIFGIIAILCVPCFAYAQDSDRVAFGADVHVREGEVVRDAVSFGGDTIIDGTVQGDAVAFGGAVRLGENARVEGDISSFGGEVRDRRTASADPGSDLAAHDPSMIELFFAWLADAGQSAIAHVLLFLLGLLLIGAARERLGAMQVTIIKDGLKTAGVGLLAYIAAGVALVVLAISILGIPVAVLLAIALPVATYIGLAAAATVIGAALPFPQLKGKEVAQLGAGVALLFVASLVPVVGTVATAVLACLGLGALVRTRFAPMPPRDLPDHGGPFRAPAQV